MGENNTTIEIFYMSSNLADNVPFVALAVVALAMSPLCLALNGYLFRLLQKTSLMHKHTVILMLSQCVAGMIAGSYVGLKMVATLLMLCIDETMLALLV